MRHYKEAGLQHRFMIPDLGDKRQLSALNLETPWLRCVVCHIKFERNERVDCLTDDNVEESFCIPDWHRLIVGD